MKRRFELVAVNTLLLLAALLVLFPLGWMVSASLMPAGETNVFPPRLLPSRVTFEHYATLFAQEGMGRFFANSLLLATTTTVLSLLFNSAAGYAFAKLRFPGRARLFRALLGALLIPAQVAMLPLFLMLRELGLVNTYAGVILPAMAGVAGIFLIRQYALSIPDDLLEAARIDGASELAIYFRIVLPLIRPILVTLAIFTFLGTWHDFFWPLIVLTDGDRFTLPVALASLSREHVQDNELMMAGAVVTVAPVLLLFLALQRFYIQGILVGSVKG